MIRNARVEEVDEIQKRVFRPNSKYVGFVMKVSLSESAQRGTLLISETNGEIDGAINYRITLKGYLTIYEIATSPSAVGRGVGTQMIDQLKSLGIDIKLKVTEDNVVAHNFYEKVGFVLVGREQGRKRPLRVYMWSSGKQRKLF